MPFFFNQDFTPCCFVSDTSHLHFSKHSCNVSIPFFQRPPYTFHFCSLLVSFLFPCVCALSVFIRGQLGNWGDCFVQTFALLSHVSFFYYVHVVCNSFVAIYLLSVDCRALSSDFSHYSMTRHIFLQINVSVRRSARAFPRHIQPCIGHRGGLHLEWLYTLLWYCLTFLREVN